MPSIYSSTGDGYAGSNQMGSFELARSHAGYIYDTNTGEWTKPKKFGGLRRLQNYKR